MTTNADLLLDMGCPAALVPAAREFAHRARLKLIELYGEDAPHIRIDDILSDCLDDPAGVVADGAADDLLGDLDAEARAFAALVMASRIGGGS